MLKNLLSIFSLFFFHFSMAAPSIQSAISQQGETVHLEFKGQTNWTYDLDKKNEGKSAAAHLFVDALDEASVKALKSFKSELVSSIEVKPNQIDGKTLLVFHLLSDKVEAFDYLTDQPSRLVVDFYVTPNLKDKTAKKSPNAKTAAAKDSDDEEAIVDNKPAKASKSAKTKAVVVNEKREPASDSLVLGNAGLPAVAMNEAKLGAFDGGDPEFSRFYMKDYEIKPEALIKSRENVYIQFPALTLPVLAWSQMKHLKPIYEIEPKETEENKQARLLLTLHEKERDGLFLKTEKWFKNKFPKSSYQEMFDYMKGDVFLRLSQKENDPKNFDNAIQAYREAIQKYPTSPLAERTSLRIGFLQLDKGDALNSLRSFQQHIENKDIKFQNQFSKDVAKMGMALSYQTLNRWKDAHDLLNEIASKSTYNDLKQEAIYRHGDVDTLAKENEKAIESYKKAMSQFPAAAEKFPSAFFNYSEDLFRTKDYKQSLKSYLEFLKKFPASENAPLAMTRIGELQEILGADPSKVIGAYLETYFRYGDNPLAGIARIHLLSYRMKNMKPAELEIAVKEIRDIGAKSDLPRMEEFASIQEADGYTSRAEYRKSIDHLSAYYKSHPSSADVGYFTRRIVGNINDLIEKSVSDGKFIQALKTHTEFEDNWLKTSKRLDTKYYLGKAYEQAGVFNEAEKYYRDLLNRRFAIKGTEAEKEVKVMENAPSIEQVQLRLSQVLADQKKFSQSYDYLRQVKDLSTLTEKEQVERVQIAADLMERKGEIDSAIRYLTELLKTWKGQPVLLSGPLLKLAELSRKTGDSEQSIQAFQQILKMQDESKTIPEGVLKQTYQTMAEIQLSKGQMDEAIKSYKTLLDKFEEKYPLASIRYKLGELYFKKGNLQLAAETWKGFKQDGEFWKNLAQEQMKNSEWRSGYKKYLNRVPAMADGPSPRQP